MKKSIDYSKFLTICHVENPSDWGGFHVRTDGVYVNVPSDEVFLTPTERAAITEHPTGNLSEPVLRLPCTVESAQAFLDAQATGIDLQAEYRTVEPNASWQQMARNAADEICKEDGCDYSAYAVAAKVEIWCRNHEIKGASGKCPSANYIRKSALKEWKAP